jgi:hypothetical protein
MDQLPQELGIKAGSIPSRRWSTITLQGPWILRDLRASLWRGATPSAIDGLCTGWHGLRQGPVIFAWGGARECILQQCGLEVGLHIHTPSILGSTHREGIDGVALKKA